MSRSDLAGHLLAATAFVLAGLLVTRVGGLAAPARGDLLESTPRVTLMTAQTADDEQALFVLDHHRGALLVYKTRLGFPGGPMGRLVLAERIRLWRLFNIEPGYPVAGPPARESRAGQPGA